MELQEIKSLVYSDSYEFLRNDPHLGDNIILLTIGGSHAYGTNIETSDLDIRGVTLNQPSDLIGMSNFEQFERNNTTTETDAVIYGFNKFIKLVSDGNPNVCEQLGMPPEYYLYLNKTGQKIIDNTHMFLSKRVVKSFGGYATAQLRRLQNALAHDSYPEREKTEHIKNSLERMTKNLYEEAQGAVQFVIDPKTYELNVYFLMDWFLPVKKLNGMMSQMTNIVRDYEKLNHRNRKKDDAHLNKHAMHLLRLLYMGTEILEKEIIITRRDSEHDLLMDIRNGKYMLEDGNMSSEFFDMVNDAQKRFDYAAEHTSLPEKPNSKLIEEFVMEVNREIILNERVKKC